MLRISSAFTFLGGDQCTELRRWSIPLKVRSTVAMAHRTDAPSGTAAAATEEEAPWSAPLSSALVSCSVPQIQVPTGNPDASTPLYTRYVQWMYRGTHMVGEGLEGR